MKLLGDRCRESPSALFVGVSLVLLGLQLPRTLPRKPPLRTEEFGDFASAVTGKTTSKALARSRSLRGISALSATLARIIAHASDNGKRERAAPFSPSAPQPPPHHMPPQPPRSHPVARPSRGRTAVCHRQSNALTSHSLTASPALAPASSGTFGPARFTRTSRAVWLARIGQPVQPDGTRWHRPEASEVSEKPLGERCNCRATLGSRPTVNADSVRGMTEGASATGVLVSKANGSTGELCSRGANRLGRMWCGAGAFEVVFSVVTVTIPEESSRSEWPRMFNYRFAVAALTPSQSQNQSSIRRFAY